MRRFPGLVILVLLLRIDGLSQPTATFHAEVGLNITSLPKIRRMNEGQESFLPLVSPLVGVWMTALPEKKVNLSLGLQYYSQGEVYRLTIDRTDALHNSTYRALTTEKLRLDQLSTGIMLNYEVPFRTNALIISIGYKLKNYISGHYRYKLEISYESAVKPDYLFEKNLDPFNDDLFIPAQRSQSQLSMSIQYSLGSRWTASTSFSVGPGLSFTEPYYGWCATGFYHRYQRSDIGISVRYRI